MTACVDLQTAVVRQADLFIVTVMEPSFSCQTVIIIIGANFSLLCPTTVTHFPCSFHYNPDQMPAPFFKPGHIWFQPLPTTS
jgi:hypothetical protein